MKKLVVLLQAMIMLLTLCACGNKKDNSEAGRKETVYLLTGRIEYDADGEILQSICFQYQKSGLIAEVKTEPISFSHSYTYDEHGTIVATAYSAAGGKVEDSTTYSVFYDKDRNLSKYFLEDWKAGTRGSYTLSYVDGQLNKVLDITIPDRQLPVFQCEYDRDGRLIQDAFFNGASMKINTYHYEADCLVSIVSGTQRGTVNEAGEWEAVSPGDPLIERIHQFSYDSDGNVIQWTVVDITYPDDQGGAVENTRLQRSYSYDSNGFPASMETTRGINSQSSVVQFTCDKYGNIVKAVNDDGSYTEYTYETRQLTAQQKENYQRQLALEYSWLGNRYNMLPCGVDQTTIKPYFNIWRQQTSNPVFSMPYLEMFMEKYQ